MEWSTTIYFVEGNLLKMGLGHMISTELLNKNYEVKITYRSPKLASIYRVLLLKCLLTVEIIVEECFKLCSALEMFKITRSTGKISRKQ